MHPTTCTSLTECVYVCVWGGGLVYAVNFIHTLNYAPTYIDTFNRGLKVMVVMHVYISSVCICRVLANLSRFVSVCVCAVLFASLNGLKCCPLDNFK